ncbi:MAG: hypothetical protein V7L21_17285 [Nostoc sp.]|uniref:hypothetical protein n=1 Tax=unclassified Nostoc TaxID=2593658 RepID=UPI0025CC0A39|nr:hypothetical protein [Nostoc sp. NMS9]MBN3943069.1 hypothetical protein [Nostoc sp. NMS9]
MQPTTRQTSPTLRGLNRLYNPSTDDLVSILAEYASSENAFVRLVTLLHPLISCPVKDLSLRPQRGRGDGFLGFLHREREL